MATQPIHPTRACNKCGVEKPLSTLNFKNTNGNPRTFTGACKSCLLAQDNETRRKRAALPGAMEKRRQQSLASYHRDIERSRHLQRERRVARGDEIRARDQQYFWANREKKREAAKRRWAKSDKALGRQKVLDWKAANPEKARALERRRLERIKADPAERAKMSARQKRWREQNPVGAAAARDRRRARELGCPGSYSRDDVRDILKVQGRYCFYCSCRLTRFHCDHFIPLAKGGSNYAENIVLSCPSCNFSKGARLPWEWRPKRFEEGCTPR